MTAILRSELFRIRRRFQTWIMAAMTLGFAVLFYAAFVVAHVLSPDSTGVLDWIDPLNAFDSGLVITQFFVPMLVVVFAAGLIGSEFDWNTLRPLVARTASRSSLLTAKWIAVILFTIGITAATVLVTYLSALVAAAIAGMEITSTSRLATDVLGAMIRYPAAVIPSAVVAMAMALVFRSNAIGIAVGIGITLIEPALFLALRQMSDVFDTIEKAGINYNVMALLQYAGDFSASAREVWISAGRLGLWSAALIGISYAVFNRRDITSA